MAVIAYLDETGSPIMTKIDPKYPVFAVMLCIIDAIEYRERLCPALQKLKFDFFGHDAVVLHSYELKKSQGDYSILLDASIRAKFLARVSELMQTHDYQLIGVAIDKSSHLARYGERAFEPYGLALEMALERLLLLLEGNGQKAIHVIAERRGKSEDRALRTMFERFVANGSFYVSSARVNAIQWSLKFVPKDMNLAGLQVADLAASPFGSRVVLHGQNYRFADPPNQAWNIVLSKEYPGITLANGVKIRGIKLFP